MHPEMHLDQFQAVYLPLGNRRNDMVQGSKYRHFNPTQQIDMPMRQRDQATVRAEIHKMPVGWNASHDRSP